MKKIISRAIYHPEVTLEDLGINVVRQPQYPTPQPQGPPDGKCPYCDAEADTADTTQPGPGGPPGPPDAKQKSHRK